MDTNANESNGLCCGAKRLVLRRCSDNKIRFVREMCANLEGVAEYWVAGPLGRVRIAWCAVHARNARRWKRRRIEKIETTAA
jgi:phosphoglycerate dehydrogenase-like enzyme